MAVVTTNVIGGAGENLTALRLEKDGHERRHRLRERSAAHHLHGCQILAVHYRQDGQRPESDA